MKTSLPQSQNLGGIFYADSPIELTARMDSPSADIVIMSQSPSVDLSDRIRVLPNFESRKVFNRHQIDRQISPWLSEMEIDSAELAATMERSISVFAETFRQEKVDVRLEATDKQSCPKFHCDNVYVRMLVTYHGPTTEFVDQSNPSVIHRAPLHALVFLKGHQHPTYQDRVLHRSPEVAKGEKRLCMIVNLPYWLEAKR